MPPTQWKRFGKIVPLATGIGIAVFASALLLNTYALPSQPLATEARAPRISTLSNADQEQAFLGLINDYRAAHGAGPLQLSSTLDKSSTWMSTDMANKNYFSHTDSLKRTMYKRLTYFKYHGTTMGENIAAGQITAQDVFNAWKNSPGHNKNMLNPKFKYIGVSLVTTSRTHYPTYWTTDFGNTSK